jgi:predicted AlkP superfamily phosphohydrolase/phosphomutase
VHSDIYLNNYLLEKGYITLKEGAETEVKVTTSVKIKSVIVKFLEKIGLWKFYRDYRLKTIPVGTVWFLKNIDWTKTKAVMASMAGKSIRLNVCNRDPIGAVNSDEVVNVIENLKKDLLDLCDPNTGEKVITKIWRGTEVYSGEYAIYAPDLILGTASGYSFHHGFSDSIIKESTQHGRIRSGDHEQFGTFILSGEGIKSGKLDKAGIMDIAPTILHIMGLPVSDEMDGKFLDSAFKEEWKKNNPLKIIEETES